MSNSKCSNVNGILKVTVDGTTVRVRQNKVDALVRGLQYAATLEPEYERPERRARKV